MSQSCHPVGRNISKLLSYGKTCLLTPGCFILFFSAGSGDTKLPPCGEWCLTVGTLREDLSTFVRLLNVLFDCGEWCFKVATLWGVMSRSRHPVGRPVHFCQAAKFFFTVGIDVFICQPVGRPVHICQAVRYCFSLWGGMSWEDFSDIAWTRKPGSILCQEMSQLPWTRWEDLFWGVFVCWVLMWEVIFWLGGGGEMGTLVLGRVARCSVVPSPVFLLVSLEWPLGRSKNIFFLISIRKRVEKLLLGLKETSLKIH